MCRYSGISVDKIAVDTALLADNKWGGLLKSLWVPVSGAIAQQRKVETIANNVANANTPGFKKDQLVFREYLTALNEDFGDIHIPRQEFSPKDFYHSQGNEHALVEIDGSFTNFKQGHLTPTHNPFDLAINGKGFFEILTPGGIRYTRGGKLTLNADRVLVTQMGFKVLSKIGPEALQNNPNNETDPNARQIIIPQNAPITFNQKGEIFQNGQKVNDLSIVEFKDPHALRKEGQLQFINLDNNNIKEQSNQSSVHQGFVENSNVNVVEEMSNLIKANRHFESIQRAIKTYDNIAGKSVNELTRF